ncbi:hypothetical protein D3C78_811720 [compost metagenome]
MQIRDGHQHTGVTATQKCFQLQPLTDKRAEHLAHQLRFAQAIGSRGDIIGLGSPLLQNAGLPVIEYTRLQGAGQPFALHQAPGLLQVQVDPIAITPVVDELRPQSLQVCQQQGVGKPRALTGKRLLVKPIAQKAAQPLALRGITIKDQVADGDKAQGWPMVRIGLRQLYRHPLLSQQQAHVTGA